VSVKLPKVADVVAVLLPDFVSVKVPVEVVVPLRMVSGDPDTVPFEGVLSEIVASLVALCTTRLPKLSTKLTLAVRELLFGSPGDVVQE